MDDKWETYWDQICVELAARFESGLITLEEHDEILGDLEAQGTPNGLAIAATHYNIVVDDDGYSL